MDEYTKAMLLMYLDVRFRSDRASVGLTEAVVRLDAVICNCEVEIRAACFSLSFVRWLAAWLIGSLGYGVCHPKTLI